MNKNEYSGGPAYLLVGIALIVAAILVAICVFLAVTPASADPLPVSQAQPRTDLFAIQNSPLAEKVRQTGEIRWSFIVMPGCRNGSWPSDFGHAMGDFYNVLNVTSIYVTNGTQDLTLRANCGLTFQQVCGTGAAACLGRGFPINNDIDFSDAMLDWPEITRVSIVCHEYCGHAAAMYNEQYCAGVNQPKPGCAGWGTPSPGWVDIMNTGELSRHYLAVDDNFVARWGRVMGAAAPVAGFFGLDGSYLYICGVLPRATGIWVSGYGSVGIGALGVYGPNLCRYLDVNGQSVCFDVGNAVDWKDDRVRTDRCV